MHQLVTICHRLTTGSKLLPVHVCFWWLSVAKGNFLQNLSVAKVILVQFADYMHDQSQYLRRKSDAPINASVRTGLVLFCFSASSMYGFSCALPERIGGISYPTAPYIYYVYISRDFQNNPFPSCFPSGATACFVIRKQGYYSCLSSNGSSCGLVFSMGRI